MAGYPCNWDMEVRAVNLIAAQISSDSSVSIGEVSMGNVSSKLCPIVTGLWEIASEALCHFPGQSFDFYNNDNPF